MWISDIFTGEDPLYHDRARRYLAIAEDVVEPYTRHQQRVYLKKMLTHAIESRAASTNNEDRSMALALWKYVNFAYPGLLEMPEPYR